MSRSASSLGPESPSVDFYANPSIYDVLYRPGTAQEVDLLERIEALYGRTKTAPARRVWLEPACGTGRYLHVIASRGQRCVGFDHNDRMLSYAHARLQRSGLDRRCQLFEAQLDDFDDSVKPASIDFAFIPVNSLRHLLHGRQMTRHFRQMARALRPGGLYVVGISLSCYGEEEIVEDNWEGRRGRLRVHQTITYLPPDRRLRREQVLSHLRVERPKRTDTVDSTYPLRSYDEVQWSRFVRSTPLRRVASLDDDGHAVADRYLDYQLEVLRR